MDWHLKTVHYDKDEMPENYQKEKVWLEEEHEDCIDKQWIERFFTQNDLEIIQRCSNPIMLLLPGFNIDSKVIFAQNAMKKLRKLGFLCVCIG